MELRGVIRLFKPYFAKQATSHEFLGRDGFDYGTPFMELSCACWLLQDRTTA